MRGSTSSSSSLGVADVDQGLELPVVLDFAELVAAVAFDDPAAVGLDDHVQVLAERKDYAVRPGDAFLEQFDVGVEPVGILERGLDRAHGVAREALVDQVREH